MAKDKGLTALEKVMIAAKAADSKKATDIVIQDVRELVSVTDFFVIVTAQNNRQVAAVKVSGPCSTSAISWCTASSPKAATTIASKKCGTMLPRLTSSPMSRKAKMPNN